MEYRCRLGTAGGELIDGVYVAESEAQLRRELEEKGLLVLSMRPVGLLAGLLPGVGRRRRIRTPGFLEFNQELATLLKAGMPLVQSLDLLRGGLTDPVFKPVLDAVYERVKAGAQLSDAFEEHGELVPRIYTASLLAGERSGNLETVLRRYVAYAKLVGGVRRRTLSALMYPVVLLMLALVVVGIIVLKLVPAFSLFYASFNAELPPITRLIVGHLRFRSKLRRVHRRRRCGRLLPDRRLVAKAQLAAPDRSLHAGHPVGRLDRAKVRDVADGADAGDAAGWRHSARAGARRRCAVGRQPLHRVGARVDGPARARRAEPGGDDARAADFS